jgi:hypothetical protein
VRDCVQSRRLAGPSFRHLPEPATAICMSLDPLKATLVCQMPAIRCRKAVSNNILQLLICLDYNGRFLFSQAIMEPTTLVCLMQ